MSQIAAVVVQSTALCQSLRTPNQLYFHIQYVHSLVCSFIQSHQPQKYVMRTLSGSWKFLWSDMAIDPRRSWRMRCRQVVMITDTCQSNSTNEAINRCIRPTRINWLSTQDPLKLCASIHRDSQESWRQQIVDVLISSFMVRRSGKRQIVLRPGRQVHYKDMLFSCVFVQDC